MVSKKQAKNRSVKTQETSIEDNTKKSAEYWLRYAPTFQLPKITLSKLQQRPKNAAKDVDAANATILKMEGEPDACSMRLVDNEGKTMVCVFSHRLPQEERGEENSEEEENPEDEDEEISEDENSEDEDGPQAKVFFCPLFQGTTLRAQQIPPYPGSALRTLNRVNSFPRKLRHWDGIPVSNFFTIQSRLL